MNTIPPERNRALSRPIVGEDNKKRPSSEAILMVKNLTGLDTTLCEKLLRRAKGDVNLAIQMQATERWELFWRRIGKKTRREKR